MSTGEASRIFHSLGMNTGDSVAKQARKNDLRSNGESDSVRVAGDERWPGVTNAVVTCHSPVTPVTAQMSRIDALSVSQSVSSKSLLFFTQQRVEIDSDNSAVVHARGLLPWHWQGLSSIPSRCRTGDDSQWPCVTSERSRLGLLQRE